MILGAHPRQGFAAPIRALDAGSAPRESHDVGTGGGGMHGHGVCSSDRNVMALAARYARILTAAKKRMSMRTQGRFRFWRGKVGGCSEISIANRQLPIQFTATL